ncbi:MAG: low molecular weight protein-tyrosine-phosphatase [Flavobacteriales bacterium]
MKILMVCLGNICRSPMAEGVLRHLAQQRGIHIEVDSAGTADYHVGDAPDKRARTATQRKGISIEHLRGRQVEMADFARFDLLLAMDKSNHSDLLQLAPDDASKEKVKLMMAFANKTSTGEVPDPYYGPDEGFDETFALLENACNGLLDAIA